NRMGPTVTCALARSGFYPAGGGRFTVGVTPATALARVEIMERGEVRAKRVVARVAGLSGGIAARELTAADEVLVTSYSGPRCQVFRTADGAFVCAFGAAGAGEGQWSSKAFVAAGAKGIVSAGFAPGSPPPADLKALAAAVKKGVTVVQSSRAGSGRIFRSERLTEAGILAGDNLNPQKARLLLALALTKTSDPVEIARMFATY
ncbi:MAG: hypothetical protein WCP68_07640, partial [Enhydrobacter sp.]